MRGFHEGKIDENLPDEELIGKYTAQLKRAVLEGWNKFNQPDWDTPDFGTIARLRENIFVFSAAKTLPLLKEISSMLTTDDGQIKSFSKFKADVLGIWEKYNVNWLNAEYDHAVASSQMAARWSEFEKNKDINPNITYRTAGDDRVRESHALLDGITKPVDDSFWDTYYPPNGWRCRCDADGSDAPVTRREFARPEIKPMFQNNVYKTGVLFPDTHPYMENLSADSKRTVLTIKDQLMADEYLKGAYKGKKGGRVDLHYLHNPVEIKDNMNTAQILADNGERVKLLPHVKQTGVKNPDASINGIITEFKSPKPNSKNGISERWSDAVEQGAKIVVFHYPQTQPKWLDFCRQVKGKANPEHNTQIEACWVIKDNILYKYKMTDLWANKHFQELLGEN